MESINKIMIAQNELVNHSNKLMKELDMSEGELMLAMHQATSTIQGMYITRLGYSSIIENKGED